jgi:diguanylate cyclase (GGDEF)-like protein/PAS domain S-box-containing protein
MIVKRKRTFNGPVNELNHNGNGDADGAEQSEAGSTADVKARPFRITLIYFIIGCLWILFSDRLSALLFKDLSHLVMFSIIKGLLFVFATSALLFGLTYRAMKKVIHAGQTIQKIDAELEKSNEQYKKANRALEKKQALLKSLINSIPDMIFYKDKNRVYIGCNKAFELYAGKNENEIIGKSDLELFDNETASVYRAKDAEMLKTNNPTKNEECVTYPDGKIMVYETLKTPYYDDAGEMIGLIGVSRDITGRKKREEDIRYLSYHDVLTGLYNRAFFQEECARLDNAAQFPLSVIVGDVNGLKLINDALGHGEGDRLLIEIAHILRNNCRECDIVARTGGDEFAILLPKTDGQTAQLIVERIKDICNDYSTHREKNILYTNIALGCATKYTARESLDKVIMMAEDFMYRRKLLEYKSLHSAILSAIKTTMSEKSNAIEEHAARLTKLSRKLGEAVGLPERIVDEIELVSTLHDIGKISIDEKILNKPDKLSDEEWREIKKHPEVGFRIANATPELRHLSEYILCHHERWDGKGYPQGLSGEDIPLISRIISITDAFDAMTQDRAYRKAMTQDRAVEEILKNAGTQFDPQLVKTFVEHVLSEPT